MRKKQSIYPFSPCHRSSQGRNLCVIAWQQTVVTVPLSVWKKGMDFQGMDASLFHL